MRDRWPEAASLALPHLRCLAVRHRLLQPGGLTLMDMAMLRIASRGFLVFAACAVMAGCMPREPVAEAPMMSAVPRAPGDQSYLNPGPVPATGTGPGYLRAANESQMRDSRFGDDLTARIP
jgi:hypothetical protein